MEEKENLNVRQGRETKLDNREKRFGEIRDKNERGREKGRIREREEGEIEGGREKGSGNPDWLIHRKPKWEKK